MSRLVKLTYPEGCSETYEYDSVGNMILKTDRNGVKTEYSYNGLGAVTKERAVKNGNISEMTAEYGMTGAKIKESNENLSISYKYNENGLLKEQASKYNDTAMYMTYRYDERGNCVYLEYKQAFDHEKARLDLGEGCWIYEYDRKDRLESVSDGDASDRQLAKYSYDLCGRVNIREYGKGITTHYTYNDAGMITYMKNKQEYSLLSDFSYDYYPNGNIKSETAQYTKEETFYDTHDGNDDVELKTESSYVYDDFGRLINEIYVREKKGKQI